MSRIDILIERAKRRAEAEKQQVGNAATGGDQTEYLIRSGLLVRCEDCRAVVGPDASHTLRGGRKLCTTCYIDFQDTAPGWGDGDLL